MCSKIKGQKGPALLKWNLNFFLNPISVKVLPLKISFLEGSPQICCSFYCFRYMRGPI